MPLTLVQTYAVKPPPPVTLITAGDDQQIACESVVILTAVVDIPGNLPGHSLEWEQTAGNAVALSCTDCLSTTYSTADQTDKVFRFWLDRNKPYEQYDDVSVTHTPSSVAPTSSQNARGELTIGTPSDVVVCESILTAADIPPPILQQGEVTGGGVKLVWDEPTAAGLESFIKQYVVYEDDVEVATVPDGNTLEYAPALPRTYAIQTDFEVNGQPSSTLSCERDFLNDLPYPTIIIIDDYAPTNSFIASPTVTFVKYSNITISDPESVTPTISQIAAAEINFVRYSNISLPDPLSESPTCSCIVIPTVNITRFDSGGIGG